MYHIAENVDEKNVQPKWIDRRLHEQRVWLSSRNIAALDNREATSDKNYSDENDGEEKTRWLKKKYYVDIAVMVDSSIWDLYASTVQVTNIQKKRDEVKRKIREAYSHIMNGVNMLYRGIDDTSISIRVILCAFIFVQHAALFPHNSSKVNRINGTTCIGCYPYHNDLSEWDMTYGVNFTPSFDHVMLFTRHDMYKDSIANNDIFGVCWQGGVCKPGKRTSVVQTDDYVRTVRTAAHELGHNLGAYHDGDDEAKDCSARDLFIMAPVDIRNDPSRLYTRNPWFFSTCSVASLKKRLKLKECVRKKGQVYNDTEWKGYVAKQPGEVYNPDEQCHLIIGPKSTYCVADLWTICHTMQCRDPKTKECINKYFSAAAGTKCGDNRVCFEGRCVPKVSK